ncbi:MAG: 2-oxoacid:acceptor oxidoreductase subunit alpha [Candidatus Heimdallarchaeota archaeon]|nr:2-oxoacid:acceptor oxidoreductase subunit alpha [Candidatus Heimdallarchaeota archaeon]
MKVLPILAQERVLTGDHFQSGNVAAAEGALAAGLQGYYGYPITPSTSVMEHVAKRLPHVEGHTAFLQCEDEIASITALIGSSWTRQKSMTATSGPGFSLMQEGIGLGSFTETPLVLVNVMRGGPSTGLPTFPAQGEIMQSHFGSHGDYLIPTFVPNSVQECFDLTVEAFNTAEALRTPVFVQSDQVLSTLKERYTIPASSDMEIIHRAVPEGEPLKWKKEIISSDLVPPMNCFGEEKKAFSTGLSHDETGHVDLTPHAYKKLVTRLDKKIKTYQHLLPQSEKYETDDAEMIIIAYGSTARSAKRAINIAREDGTKVGLYRLRTIWPFPVEDMIKTIGNRPVLVVEMSKGQLIWPVERYLRKEVSHLAEYFGSIPPPSMILNKIKSSMEEMV